MLILILLLLLASGPAAAQDTFTGIDRIIAIGDIHGDYDAFTTILRSADLIDKKGKWIAGKTHLVQMGDMLDRGPDSRKVMDLLISLEKQAAKAGGRVHSLLGNHEAMNLYGDLRYAVPGEFAAYKSDNAAALRDVVWQNELKLMPSKPDGAARKKWEEEHPLGWVEQRLAFAPDGTYGKWLRTHKAVLKLDDTVFLHGGISPNVADMSIASLNEEILSRLNDFTKIKDGDIVTGDDSPLWYRGLATGVEAELMPHVDKLLQSYGVKRIVIAHTPTPGKVLSRFGGKVLLTDVSMSKAFGSLGRACLVIEGDKIYAIDNGQKVDIAPAP